MQEVLLETGEVVLSSGRNKKVHVGKSNGALCLSPAALLGLQLTAAVNTKLQQHLIKSTLQKNLFTISVSYLHIWVSTGAEVCDNQIHGCVHGLHQS